MLACLVVWLGSGPAYGVPACPGGATLRQPDGTPVTIFLRGDERAHWHEDAAGYLVTRLPKTGQWVYALEVNGAVVPTDRVVGRVDPRAVGLAKPDVGRIVAQGADRDAVEDALVQSIQSESSGPTVKNLVILASYADLAVEPNRLAFDDLFNQIGYTADGAVGSVKDYYLEVTYGGVTVESVVVEPVTLDHGYAYYGANVGGDDVRPRQMAAEALAKLEARGFDFTSVDGNGDNLIDGLAIIHAGGGEEYGGNDPNYIWSHQWVLPSPVIYDGVLILLYHTEPARRGWDSNPSTWGITRIGVICHEMGHFFSLPDLYDYGGDSRGCGRFCLMAGGSWNGNYGTSPAHMSAWCKVALGLVTPTVISAGGNYTLDQVETAQQIYKLQGSFSSNEYFLVENRQGVGFDAGLPGSSRGMLIWHVDENRPNNNDQTHYKVDLEEASGTQHLELNLNSGQDSDYFRLDNATSFTASTTPGNLSYAGTPLGMNIANVGATGATMSFDVFGPYHLTVNVNYESRGCVELTPEPNDPNDPVYFAGTEVTLTAVPTGDNTFGRWRIFDPNYPGDVNHIVMDPNLSVTIVMDADRVAKAVFECGGGGAPMPPMVVLGVLSAAWVVRRARAR